MSVGQTLTDIVILAEAILEAGANGSPIASRRAFSKHVDPSVLAKMAGDLADTYDAIQSELEEQS